MSERYNPGREPEEPCPPRGAARRVADGYPSDIDARLLWLEPGEEKETTKTREPDANAASKRDETGAR
jgi:hypothetical protein